MSGSALDFKAAEDGITRFGALAASGKLTFTDPRFQRIASRVYSGAPPPVAGSTILLVTDATTFPASGQVYVGRGTINSEGPLTYTSKTSVGQFWQLALSSPTTKFHNANEDVVVAQGGNRSIPVGTTATTAKDGRTAPTVYSTTAYATILDGEIQVTGVPIICRTPGRVGNTPHDTIVSVTSAPFPQVGCTNPTALTNARDTESDDDFKERLRNTRASKSRGTRTAILTGVQGISSVEDQKSVLSAELVQPAGEPATLYIDDGTGYEEINQGVAFEALMDAASGGERYFALSGRRPVAKAFVLSSLQAPFALQNGAELAVTVGGQLHTHVFNAVDFTSIGSATAQEVVSSINADPTIGFSARTAEGSTKVSIFGRQDVNEDLAVGIVSPPAVDANIFLGFSNTPAFTLRLYKNDQILYKDGRTATIIGAPQSSWSTIVSGVEFNISVDGTPAVTYVITDADFVAAGTGFTSVSQTNSVASWAQVLNYKIPGITAADGGGFLTISSNLGANRRAAIKLASTINPNLVQAGVFTALLGLSAQGIGSDYSLDRMTGEIKLTVPLAAGDSLTAGSDNTRAAIVSAVLTGADVTLLANARLFIAVDSGAQAVKTNIGSSTSFTVSQLAADRTQYVASDATAFGTSASLLQIGDYVIIWDPAFTDQGVFRISDLPTTAPFNSFTVERPAPGGAQSGVVPTAGGLKFFRLLTGGIQTVRVASGASRPLTDIAAEISAQLANATASVFRNSQLQLRSNDFRQGISEIVVLTADAAGQQLQLPLGTIDEASLSHRGADTSAAEVGTPVFGNMDYVQSAGVDLGPLAIGYTNIAASKLFDIWGDLMYAVRRQQEPSVQHFGAVVDRHYPVAAYNTGTQRMSLRHVEPGVILTSLVRTAGVVTVTMPGIHRFCIGDLVWVGPQSAADVNFSSGYPGVKVVASVPTTSTWTYVEAGSDGTASTPYAANIWYGIFSSATATSGDLLTPVRPLAIGAYDTLNFTLNGDTLNQAYVVPMQRRVKPLTASYLAGSPIQVVDLDNGSNPLSATFGTVTPNFFQDFWVYQHARTVSHKVLSGGQYHEAILWRAVRFGPEGNRYWMRYLNPKGPAAAIVHTVDVGIDANVSGEPAVYFSIYLPSDAARTGLNLFDTTMWTWTATNISNYTQVVLQYSAPTIPAGHAPPGPGMTRTGGNLVTAVTSSPHGFSSGQIVYLSSTDGNFPAGPKFITVISGTEFQYSEAGANVDLASTASVSAAPGAPTLTSIAVGDIINIKTNGVNLVQPPGQWRVYAVNTSSNTITIRVPQSLGVTTQTTPKTQGNAGSLEFYPISSTGSTASAVVSYALTAMQNLVTPTLLGLGDGTLLTSTQDEWFQATVNTGYSVSVPAWQMSSGLSWVASSDLAASPNTITLKAIANPNPDIQTIADFTNEELRLVPVLASSVAAWLASPAVTGAYVTTDFNVSGPQYDIQASSQVPGSQGGIQVTGGLANAVTMTIQGGAEQFLSSYGRLLVDAGLVDGIMGDQYVALQNSLPTPKSIDFTGCSLQVFGDGTVTITSGAAVFWNLQQFGTGGDIVAIHRVGAFTVFCLPTSASVTITDPRGFWFQLSSAGASQVNKNIRRVVGYQLTSNHHFIWVEDSNTKDEIVVLGGSELNFWDPDSALPGDTLEISFPFGAALNNQGSFTITAQGGSGASVVCNHAFTPAGPTALGTNASLVRVTEPAFRLIERVRTLVENPLSPTSFYVLFAPSGTATQLSKLNPALGANLAVLDKLEYSTDPANGADGYAVSIGLIGEVVRTLYGDPNAPTLFPGIVAVGSTVYVSGPNAKRIRVSLQIRIRTGQPLQTVMDRVRAAVATEINRVPLGVAVDLSRIVGAARKVQGVVSVVVLSPTYTSTQDTIAVQANEKPFVFDAQADILLTPLSA